MSSDCHQSCLSVYILIYLKSVGYKNLDLKDPFLLQCPNGSLDIKCEQNGGSSEIPQKIKQIPDFKLTEAVEYLISEDVDNEKVWNDCLANKDQGFLQKVRDNFMCICCRDLVYNPITTYCKHNICKVTQAFCSSQELSIIVF